MFWSRLTRAHFYSKQFHSMQKKIEVPTYSISHIIGKGGANIKDIQNRSGAKCSVQGNYVIIIGSSDSQRIAHNLIQNCIDNSIAVYNHPLEAIIALRQPLIGLKSVKFVKYQGIVDEYNVNKAYFVLDKGEEMSQIDKVNKISSLESLGRVSNIVIPEEDSTLVIHITKRLIEEVNKSHNRFLLKVQTNIGKQLFYPAKKGVVDLPTYVPLDHLIKYKVGNKADVKATFMNRLPLGIEEVVESHLKKLGYEESNTTQRASIHLIDVKERQRITISNDITSEGHLKLRKCRSDNISHLFLSFVRPKSTLDFRFKVLSHKEPMNIIPSKIRHIIDNSSYNFDAKVITLPNVTDNADYRITTTRTKIKRKFINNTGNKVTISNVYETGKVDVQMTVTNLRLHEVLTKIKNQEVSTNKGELKKELEKELEEKVGKFVDEMNRIVDGAQWDG
ncbi:hypothetical protein RclHR1_08270003 [Rhizophagus clarus]|nr:hypothetical protein RclHR1_08270003 [Rhizophagus clarus]